MNQNKIFGALAFAAVFVWVLASSVYAVNENEQAVVVRFGEIVRVEQEAGPHFKLPLVEQSHVASARLLGMMEEAQPFRTADGRDIVADVLVTWRIVDARQFYVSTGAQDSTAKNILRQAVTRRLGDEFGKRSFKNLVAAEWRQLMADVGTVADSDVRKAGLAIVDVRLQRLGMPSNQAVFERMRVERARLASERRDQGTQNADRIRLEAERTRDAVLAEGYARSERIRGEGEARAAAIYANAAAVAPEFFSFYRSLNAYKESFKKKEDVLVVDPSADFFKYMKKPTR